jgi:hypothetical protein
MEGTAKRLLKAGFVKKDKEKEWKKLTSEEKKSLSDKKAAEYADVEEMEVEKGITEPTDFPYTKFRHRFIRESTKLSMEETYFWIMSQIKQAGSFHHFIKIKDLFTASEQSSMFGNAQQRLSAQQDKASQYLAVIGKMVKELFQLVRELRILDERLKLYESSNKGDVASEVTLKGIWIDLVEGGSKNPASVYGMAREVGFATLPDLFFDVNVKNSDDVDKKVESTDFNKKVKEVLKRKLKTYILWKENTEKELFTKRKFTLTYMRQHYDAIRMYMEWVKPYLGQIKKMMMDTDKLNDANLVSAFEGSLIDVEFLAFKKSSKSTGKYCPCIIATFNYRTTPAMNYHAEGYQRGPIHMGKVECTLRGYVWTEEQIAAYKKYREDEAFEVLTSIDTSLKEAMDSLGNSMKDYLREAGEKMDAEEAPKAEKIKQESILSPFFSIFSGLFEILSSFTGGFDFVKGGGKSKADAYEEENQKEKVADDVRGKLATTFINYKKAHSMLAW